MEADVTQTPAADYVLDCSGTLCPLPIVRLRQELDRMEVGKVIHVIATDPASVNDMPAFARNTGHELLESLHGNGVFQFYFRKAEEDGDE
jgi:tRNA 2-thiouridine synthesizing protein A